MQAQDQHTREVHKQHKAGLNIHGGMQMQGLNCWERGTPLLQTGSLFAFALL
jgi:hypothetical protein